MPMAALRPETGFSPGQIGYEAVLQKHKVPVRFHADFVSFMQTGKATDNFVRYVNATPSCQEAVEEVLAQHMKNLRPLLQAFSSSAEAAPSRCPAPPPVPAEAEAACVD
jgi:hypothetical protein